MVPRSVSAIDEPQRDIPLRYRPLVTQCAEIARRLDAPELADETLRAVRSAFGPVRVALLGQQAAKVPLVNLFLGVEALDAVYGQGRVRRVTLSEHDAIVLNLDKQVTLPVDAEGWAQVDGLPPDVDVEVGISSEALRKTHAELVDFPMSRELRAGGSDWRALQLCHLVILLVDAPSMVTRTEAEVMRDLSVSAGPPCAGVAVTGISSVPQHERGAVLDGIAQVVRRSAGTVDLLVVDDPPTVASAFARMLASATEDARLRGGRDWQVEALLRAVLLDLRTLAEERRKLRRLNAGDQTRELDQLRERHRDALDILAALKQSLPGRTATALERLRGDVAAAKRDVSSQLLSDLDHADDLQSWWAEELPEAFDIAFTRAVAGLDERLGAIVGEQLAWVQGELADAGVDARAQIDLPPPPGLRAPATLLPDDHSDRLRAVSRLSAQALQMLGPILGVLLLNVPLVGLDRVPGAILTPQIKTNEARVQKLLRKQVTEAFSHVYDNAWARVDSALSELMATLRDEITRRHEATRRSIETSLLGEAAADEHLLGELDSAMKTLANLENAQ